MKTAIIIVSDPKSGSEEALGRVFNHWRWLRNVRKTETRWRCSLTGPGRVGRQS